MKVARAIGKKGFPSLTLARSIPNPHFSFLIPNGFCPICSLQTTRWIPKTLCRPSPLTGCPSSLKQRVGLHRPYDKQCALKQTSKQNCKAASGPTGAFLRLLFLWYASPSLTCPTGLFFANLCAVIFHCENGSPTPSVLNRLRKFSTASKLVMSPSPMSKSTQQHLACCSLAVCSLNSCLHLACCSLAVCSLNSCLHLAALHSPTPGQASVTRMLVGLVQALSLRTNAYD